MIDLGKQNVLGIGVNGIDYEGAVTRILSAAKQKQPLSVTALAVHGVMTGVLDAEHHYRLNQFDIVCPDGQPVRWALNRLAGCQLPDRVYGPELTLRICKAAADQGVSIFLFGTTDAMLATLQSKLKEQFPNLKIAGAKASAFRQLQPAERDALAEQIRSSGAEICFVGLGCPRQEVFAYEMRDRLGMPLIAVGAAFAFHTGDLEQAPPWMQRHGLEWFYRLTREPKRLWRRYLYLNPLYLTLFGLQKTGLYRRQIEQGRLPADEQLFG